MPKTRPKSFPNAEILSSGSSDSGLESDNISICSTIESDVDKSLNANQPEFQFGNKQSHRERMHNLQNALDWAKGELIEMKLQDKQLARTIIDLRSKIQQTKLDFECINDNGYDSEADDSAQDTDAQKKNATSPTGLTSFHFLGINGDDFEQNKRATWAI